MTDGDRKRKGEKGGENCFLCPLGHGLPREKEEKGGGGNLLNPSLCTFQCNQIVRMNPQKKGGEGRKKGGKAVHKRMP